MSEPLITRDEILEAAALFVLLEECGAKPNLDVDDDKFEAYVKRHYPDVLSQEGDDPVDVYVRQTYLPRFNELSAKFKAVTDNDD